MTKVDIISGFLGAGKTTLIKKLLSENFNSEKIVIIENEFGEVGIDGSLLKETGIQIKELNSGCICCSIAGDFSSALKEVLKLYQPDRIIIEPSGVGKLTDVKEVCSQFAAKTDAILNVCITVVDVIKFKMYLRNFSEFFTNQIAAADVIVLSRTQKADSTKINEVVGELRKINPSANIITNNWEELESENIYLQASNSRKTLFEKEALEEVKQHCCCGHHQAEGHKHEHDHTAQEIFDVWGVESSKVFSIDEIDRILTQLDTQSSLGCIIRAKGIVTINDGQNIQFDYVPTEKVIRQSSYNGIGRLCVIGQNLNKDLLNQLFGI